MSGRGEPMIFEITRPLFRWRLRPLFDLDTRVVTISPAWVLIGAAAIGLGPALFVLVLLVTP